MQGLEFFYENIAEELDEQFLRKFVNQLKDEAENLFDNRQQWYNTISSSIEALGMAPVSNSPNLTEPKSRIVDSAFLQTLLTLVTTFISELFPPKNIVHADIKNRSFFENNKQDPNLLTKLDDLCSMATEDMNQKLSMDWTDWRPVMEKGLRSCFLTGGAVFKIYIDPLLERPVLKLIPPTHILIPNNTDSLEGAQVIFHVFTLTEEQLEAYISSGIFTDQYYSPDDGDVIDAAENVKNAEENNSGTLDDQNRETKFGKRYTFCEAQTWFSGEESGDEFFRDSPFPQNYYKNVPYNLIFHWSSNKTARVERGWNPDEPKITKLMSMVKITYFEGGDFWGDGLAKISLNIHRAATQIFQDLMKSLMLSNTKTLAIGGNMNIKNSSFNIELGKVNTLPINGESLNDCIKEINLAQPSPMFKEFWADLRNQLSSIAGISTLKFDNIPANIQTSVLLAVLDNQTKPMSTVLQHLQIGFNQILSILQRLMAVDLGHEEFLFHGSGMYNQQIYGESIKIISAIDPSLSNTASQMIRAQTMYDMGTANPTLVKMHHILQEVFKILKIDNPDNFVFTDQEIEQQQQQAQEQAQQQQQAQEKAMQQQAEQAQAQADAQNQLLSKDLEIKADSNNKKYELDQLKLATEAELKQKELENKQALELIKIEFEKIKEQGELTKQFNIEQTQLFKAFNEFLIEKTKLEHELGIELPTVPEPKLKEYTHETSPAIERQTMVSELEPIEHFNEEENLYE